MTPFFISTWWVDWKNMQKKIFMLAFFKIHFIRFEMHMDRPDKSENIYLLSAPIIEHNAGAKYFQIFFLNFFLHLFAIHSSSWHEKRCQMLERIFCLFQCSINIGWHVWKTHDCLMTNCKLDKSRQFTD